MVVQYQSANLMTLRSVRFDIGLAADQMGALQTAMGSLAGARLSFLLTVDHPNRAVEVAAPAASRPLAELHRTP